MWQRSGCVQSVRKEVQLSYCNEPLTLTVKGPLSIIGPSTTAYRAVWAARMCVPAELQEAQSLPWQEAFSENIR